MAPERLDEFLFLRQMGDADVVPGLQALAEQDARIVTSGNGDGLVWDDENLRRRLLDAITTLLT